MNTIEQELDDRYPIHEDMGEMAEFHQSCLRAAFRTGVKLAEENSKWHDFKRKSPSVNKVCEFITISNGIREGKFINDRTPAFVLTDILHPAQNAHLPMDQILYWRYKIL